MKSIATICLLLALAACASTQNPNPRKPTSDTAASEEATKKNIELVKKYFELYSQANATEVANLYAPNEPRVFEDPVFGRLSSVESRVMLQIVLRGGQAKLEIKNIEIISADAISVNAKWTAVYNSPLAAPGTTVPVENELTTFFLIRGEKIAEQEDRFSTCAWITKAKPGVTSENCETVFKQVSMTFKAALSSQMKCLRDTGKPCPPAAAPAK